MKRLLVWVLVLMMSLASVAWAEEDAQVKMLGLPLGESYVYYPQMDGMADAALQETVNQTLLDALGVPALLNRIALTMQSPIPLQVDYTASMTGQVLTCVLHAAGPVLSDRYTETWGCANIDLQTGAAITLDDLFTDSAAASAAMEEYLDFTVAPALSAHLANSQLTPLPETFGLSDTGITFYYNMDQLSTLSDKAGTVTILWCEVQQYLNLAEGGILDRIGAKDMLTLNAEKIRQTVESGALPGLPAALGARVQAELDEHGLLIDPDLYEGGRMFQLEDGAFRGAYLLSDSLMETWEHSVVQGLRADRLNFYGLCTGVTQRQQWLDALGQPDATVEMDWAAAESYRMVPGMSDYYSMGDYQLRLHADENGALASVILTK